MLFRGPSGGRSTVRAVTTYRLHTTDEPEDERTQAEELYNSVCRDIEQVINEATGEERASLSFGERLAETQLAALQAIYRELRHGHDQLARQTEAMAAHTEALKDHAAALKDHAGEMHELRGALLDHADELGRSRSRGR